MSLTIEIGEGSSRPAHVSVLTAVYEAVCPELAKRSFLVEVSFVTGAEIATLNEMHRNKPEPTDVLSFPLHSSLEAATEHPAEEVPLGNIVIATDVATNLGETPLDLIHHGLLHLIGFDHETDLSTWQDHERAIIEEANRRGLFLAGLPIPS